ncbi:MAG TPA: asparagine synthase (glutamine-hydrolyzing) [Methylomirabilota bacterium]|nr:asparagine synthase (glutamine-hydrolyzing) [Methylomirabilota bacterium]
MCGIAGWVGRGAAPPTLDAMLAALEHRGPDDTGRFVAADVALGMTRLSIIDLVTGQQPMTTEDGAATVVFNGEIYNFRAVRRDLEARGRRFRTQSDTEVILRAWQTDGEACVERLRGMFAFAVWDAPRQRLFLARDRVGKKPLYYATVDGALVFASEIKALLRYPGVPRAVDPEALHHYLAFGYTPGARSIFAGIAKLPPGHTAAWVDGRLDVRRYWMLPPGGTERLEDDAALRARIRDAIQDAVRLRLEADVPLGVFLSGGMDSSVIVAAMRRVTSGRIATFSIGFGPDVGSFDELPYARAVAERFETEHHEERVTPNVAKVVPAIVRQFDEPFADSSAIPTYLVSGATAQHVKVALSGIGGDETFAGYPRYLGVRVSEWYARAPRAARAMTRAAVALVGESDRSRNLGDWARRFAAGGELPMPARYLGWTRFFDVATLSRVVTPALGAWLTGDVEAAQRAAWAGRGHGDAVDGAFRIDLATYLPDDLLTMADRMSMAHSLELRAPFCDHVLIEETLRIPPAVKLAGFRLKAFLRSLFADTLPPRVLAHRKQGFMIPLARWLRGELRPLMSDLLAPDVVRARGLFVVDAVEALKAEHLAGRRGHADRLWTLMMLEAWLREYLDGAQGWRLT